MLHAFPEDKVVGEEDADVLRNEKDTRALVWDLVKGALDESPALVSEIGTVRDAEEMMNLIDRGNDEGGASGSEHSSGRLADG